MRLFNSKTLVILTAAVVATFAGAQHVNASCAEAKKSCCTNRKCMLPCCPAKGSERSTKNSNLVNAKHLGSLSLSCSSCGCFESPTETATADRNPRVTGTTDLAALPAVSALERAAVLTTTTCKNLSLKTSKVPLFLNYSHLLL